MYTWKFISLKIIILVFSNLGNVLEAHQARYFQCCGSGSGVFFTPGLPGFNYKIEGPWLQKDIKLPMSRYLRNYRTEFFLGTITLWASSRDILRVPLLVWPLKMSLEIAHKVIVQQKKNYVPQFLKQRDINSYFFTTIFCCCFWIRDG
jgi:hypothetical protein